ncbi:MAG: T9SS type A sorting domain-containing protein, partial [Fibrobacteres bacterium]|nr:T9SS type A sorting domain-containing protein [Fibrobacterota bacterium]
GLSKGLWYVGVECATEVTVVETRQKPDSLGMDSIQYDSYSGKTGVLNGVSYIVNARMDYVDATAPTAPANLSYGQDTIKPGILLSWKESSDNETGIAYYNIYRNGEKIASVQTLSYKDGSADLRMATDYSYAVASVNGAGLESQQTLLQAHTSDYLIVDDGDNSRYYKTSYTGDWPLSTASGSFNGGGSVYSKTVGATYTWEASVTTGKLHKIQIWYPSFASRAGAVPISVFDGDTKVFSTVLNQKVLGSRWIDITEIVLSSETARVVVTSTSTDSSTSADAVRFIVNSGSTASEGDSLENSFKLNSFVSVSPNPFNPVTSIRIVSGHIKNGIVKVSVFNNCGQLVNVVKSSYSGYSATVNWDASNRPGGLYFFKVNNGKQTQTVKAMLLK